jgi:NADH dehydrogenase FAD-containing subunit
VTTIRSTVDENMANSGGDTKPSSGGAALLHIVILGAGFGGLTCARALRRVPAMITMIDERNFRLFQPLLYQVATAVLSPVDIAMPIRRILQRQGNAKVMLGRVEAGPQLLPAFPASLGETARRSLQQLGVEVLTVLDVRAMVYSIATRSMGQGITTSGRRNTAHK